jgi:hypothetical protein
MIKVVFFVISRLFILLLAVFSTIPFMHNSITYNVYIKGLVKKVANMNVIHDVGNFKTFIPFMFLVTRFTVDSVEHSNLFIQYLL